MVAARPLNRTLVGVLCAVLLVGAALAAVRIADVSSAGAAVPGEVNVAVFFDPAYTDTSTSGGGEAYNVKTTFEDAGFVVTTFVGVTTSDWTTALAGQQVVAVPELSNDLEAALEPGAITAIQDFTDAGGRFIVFEGPSNMDTLVNSVFGFAVTGNSADTCPCTLDIAAAAGTEFEGGPSTLEEMNSMGNLSVASLPTGSLAIYLDDVDPDSSAVTRMPYGSGFVLHFGWDWFFDDEEEANWPAWFQVLTEGAGVVTAPPTTSTTTTTPPAEDDPLPPLRFTG